MTNISNLWSLSSTNIFILWPIYPTYDLYIQLISTSRDPYTHLLLQRSTRIINLQPFSLACFTHLPPRYIRLLFTSTHAPNSHSHPVTLIPSQIHISWYITPTHIPSRQQLSQAYILIWWPIFTSGNQYQLLTSLTTIIPVLVFDFGDSNIWSNDTHTHTHKHTHTYICIYI